jgi:hypothetical protein
VVQIDAQLPSADLSPTEQAQAVRLRNQGEGEHNAGNRLGDIMQKNLQTFLTVAWTWTARPAAFGLVII